MASNIVEEAKKRPPILIRGSGDLAGWAIKLALRLSMFKNPGDYDFRLRVRDDGTRELAVIEPRKYEHLGK